MNIKKLIPLLLVVFLMNCENNIDSGDDTIIPETPLDAEFVSLKGTIDFVDPSTLSNINLNLSQLSYEVNSESDEDIKEKIGFILSKGLNINPFNLKYTVDFNTNNTSSPRASFVSDFDREIEVDNRYRLPITIIVGSNSALVPGTTGGFIDVDGQSFGFGFGSELLIEVGEREPQSNIIEQKITLSGNLVQDNNSNSNIVIGSFSIELIGNNFIDLSVFDN